MKIVSFRIEIRLGTGRVVPQALVASFSDNTNTRRRALLGSHGADSQSANVAYRYAGTGNNNTYVLRTYASWSMEKDLTSESKFLGSMFSR